MGHRTCNAASRRARTSDLPDFFCSHGEKSCSERPPDCTMAYCDLNCDELAPLCARLEARQGCPCEGAQSTYASFAVAGAACRTLLSCATPYASEEREHCLLASLCQNRCAANATPAYCKCDVPNVSG